jgi:hypothetical protein
MALSILDGNQSATTLSTIVTSGQHIPAHTVVSIGTQAITDISGAISGSTVCVGNLGLLQSTVATEGLSASGSFIKIGGHTGTSTTGNIVHVSAVGALRVDGSVYTQPVSIASVTIGNTVTIAGTVTANPTGTQTIAGTVTANLANVVTTDLYSVSSAVKVTGADGQGVLLGGLNSIGNPENVYEGGAIPVRGQVGMDVPISGTVTIGSALPAGTNRIGVVTIGGGTVTIGAGTAQIGSVTASISGAVTVGGFSSVSVGSGALLAGGLRGAGVFPLSMDVGTGYLQTKVESLPALVAGTAQIGSVTASISNSVTIASLPAISGTVTANTFALQGTAVTTSNFTSTTASTVLAGYNATREVLTIFNEGAGNLHICAGATCTTIAYQVRLSAGDYYEVPNHQTTITHSAVFATAGTARVTQVS